VLARGPGPLDDTAAEVADALPAAANGGLVAAI
jgi:hypothetical protein